MKIYTLICYKFCPNSISVKGSFMEISSNHWWNAWWFLQLFSFCLPIPRKMRGQYHSHILHLGGKTLLTLQKNLKIAAFHYLSNTETSLVKCHYRFTKKRSLQKRNVVAKMSGAKWHKTIGDVNSKKFAVGRHFSTYLRPKVTHQARIFCLASIRSCTAALKLEAVKST